MYTMEVCNIADNFISDDECQLAIEEFKASEYRLINGIYGRYADGTDPFSHPAWSTNGKNEDWNRAVGDSVISDAVTWKRDCEEYDTGTVAIKAIMHRLLSKYRQFDKNYKNDYINVTRLNEGAYITPHVDIFLGESEFNAAGYITSVVYLQTCEEGGSIILDDKYTYDPVRLSLIEFDGRLTKHEVEKIEKGSRIAMVSGYSICK